TQGYSSAASDVYKRQSKQYVSIVYNERLAEHGIAASTGTVGDCYDNALAENVNGPSQERADPHSQVG
ncbi:hypothetical protein AY520_07755, partial [Corynebacterium diphtheriae bv. mitis]